ncbi:D-hexose-6-phosphate mutarotase [Methylomagnum sp.]
MKGAKAIYGPDVFWIGLLQQTALDLARAAGPQGLKWQISNNLSGARRQTPVRGGKNTGALKLGEIIADNPADKLPACPRRAIRLTFPPLTAPALPPHHGGHMDSAHALDLEHRLGIPGAASFTTGPHGMPVVEVSNALCAGTIALQGAHLLNWTPHAQAPVIWLSPLAKFGPGKSVRGGVPVCWPWFGPHRGESGFPTHGFARSTAWEPIEAQSLDDDATRLGFRLVATDASLAQWPHATPLEIHYTLGAALEIELLTRNATDAPVVIGEALHAYFAVSDVRGISVAGLDGCEYLDKVEGGQRKRQAGAIAFTGETDRVYLNTAADCLIVDPGLHRCLRIEKQGSHSTVVWNPWDEKARKMGDMTEEGYLGMVCVESANAAEDVVAIPPGGEHRLWVRYSVEALA